MKTRYQAPELYTLVMNGQDAILMNTSETTVSGDKGGWVKGNDAGNDASPRSDYNVWNDDWSK